MKEARKKKSETRYLLSGKNKAILLKSVKDVKENKALIQKELFPED
ncbi:hypothetical protein [Flavobacterium branchiophilum]|uniref:Uncharacterized protein n=1 Tax=Flavobacterium branchiophilum TaxID=55197 RepID=A0A543G2G9_9FLAO|nr:hypothetical protein [Flavobacterium branchiophilum]TQM40257.1 hypothetical protein BC670_1135 [Flavobacterium branchiophilum]GEM53955.1 hypothetical protein FB1_01760 [Flavobacterium branchiophilum NBRC 15030 = ATCC 35035]